MSNPIAKTHADGSTSEHNFKPGANRTDKIRITELHKAGCTVDEIAVQTRVNPEVVERVIASRQ